VERRYGPVRVREIDDWRYGLTALWFVKCDHRDADMGTK